MSSDHSQVSVLVVDDEPGIRQGLERTLARLGCRVANAADGQSALDALAREPFSIVLLDLKMPGMDGLEVLRRISQLYPDILVIVITGYATAEAATEAMKLGAYDFVSKPFQPGRLRVTVGRAIERKSLIEEAKRSEEERLRTLVDLGEEKSRTRTIIQAMPNGVAVTDRDGRVVLMNPAFCQEIGLNPETRPGEHISFYIQEPEICDLVVAACQGPAQAGQTTLSGEFAAPEGRYLMALATRVANDEGACLGAVLVLVDITELKVLDRLRTEFVAKVSHELRSPLSTMYLQLGLLLGDGGEAEEQKDRHLLARVQEKTMGLISTVGDLLDISRLESGEAKRRLAQVSLEELLTSVVESLSPQAQDRKQTLTLELPPDKLPCLTADPTALESVFNNLIANAIKYTGQGGLVEVKAVRQDGGIKVDVRDNGFGIEPQYLDQVFEKFFRVKNEKTRYITGTGLGLPIVKNIVESMGGQISVQSEFGRGSTFTVLLPVQERAD